MKRLIYISCLLLFNLQVTGQDPDDMQTEAQYEASAAASDQEQENDHTQQAIQFLLRHPIAINRVAPEELIELQLLTEQQAEAFRHYRILFGPIRNAYELQAIPTWDIATIRKILPLIGFVETGEDSRLLQKIFTKGQHQVILRSSSLLEKASGFKADSMAEPRYAGSPLREFFRYTYQYKQQLWWGFTNDKDAGEKWGDFSSFHLFIKRGGWLKTIALGDYTVNIGQGLVQWQGLAFGKTSAAMNVFHQGNLLQAYRSGGEWNFNRGVAVQFQVRNLELTVFVSSKKQTANLVSDGLVAGFSSISESGYHRSPGELADRNSITQKSGGAVIQYSKNRIRLGISVIKFNFSKPALPEDKPYNLYAIRGTNWLNSGVHYSYTARNVFFFGEAALCKSGFAILQGMVMSIHHKADLSVVYRKVQPGYQSLYGRAFTENSSVTNETGLYTALRLTPWPGWTLQFYADYFRFPWLRFRADAPGSGQEYFVELGWLKRKKWTTYLRYRSTGKPENEMGGYLNEPVAVQQSNLRLHIERIVSPKWLVSGRFDYTWYAKAGERQGGHAIYLDSKYQWVKTNLFISTRVQYFNTGGYESRVYAYERDLLYSFSIPAFYDRGLRYYVQVQGKPARFGKQAQVKLQWWLRWSQTRYAAGHTIGSGSDEINGNKKSEWKMQLMLTR